MKQIFDQAVSVFITGLKAPAAILVFGFGPLFLVGWILLRKKARYKSESSEPFTELPLRPAGESVRLKIERLNERFYDRLGELAITNVTAVIIVIMADAQKGLYVVTLAAFTLVSYIRNVPVLFRTARESWDYRLGFAGERVVAEELNQLLAQGFRVFHDVPFGNFNIDHVIVGSPGVYAVETKTRRKPSHVNGKDRAKIMFRNGSLQFPSGAFETKSVEQARLNAATLSRWLSKATGEPVRADAILTFPGWFVERHEVSDVNVLNPLEIKKSFPKRVALESAQLERIAYQLTERCRMPKEKPE